MKISNILIMILGIILGVALFSSLISNSYNQIHLIEGDNQEYQNFTLGEHNLSILSTYPSASCSDFSVYNATGGEEIIASGNYTAHTNCSYVALSGSPYLDTNVSLNYSYQAEPEEYIEDSFARSMINFILGLFSLIILGGIISFFLKNFENK